MDEQRGRSELLIETQIALVLLRQPESEHHVHGVHRRQFELEHAELDGSLRANVAEQRVLTLVRKLQQAWQTL